MLFRSLTMHKGLDPKLLEVTDYDILEALTMHKGLDPKLLEVNDTINI